MDLNKVSLIGTVVKISSYKSQSKSKEDLSEIRLCLTTTYTWKDTKQKTKKSVEFHDVIAHGHLADVINEYVKEDSKLYVEGRLTHMLSEINNRKHYEDVIIAEDIIVLGKRGDKSNA